MATRTISAELTPRQREVLDLIRRGHTNSEIAETLGISLAGAKWHVSELLGRLGVESRDELAEVRVVLPGHGPGPLRRLSALTGLGLVKGALAGSGVLAAAAGTAWVATGALDGNDRGPQADPGPAGQVLPTTPVAVATLPPQPPGAVLTPAEAVARALAASGRYISQLGDALVDPPDPSTLVLRRIEWKAAVETLPSVDPDGYWQSDEGPLNAWYLYWETPDLAVHPDRAGGRSQAPIEVEVVLLDAHSGHDLDGGALAARATLRVAPDGGVGGGSGWRSRRIDERIRQISTPTGPAIRVAWFNNEVGSAWISAEPRASGAWCLVEFTASGEGNGAGCGFSLERPIDRVSVGHSATYDPATGNWSAATLYVTMPPEAAWFEVRGEGRPTLRYEAGLPPEATGLPARFGFATAGQVDFPVTVIVFDAAGKELGREDVGLANANPPPPPPLTSP